MVYVITLIIGNVMVVGYSEGTRTILILIFREDLTSVVLRGWRSLGL